MSREREGSPVEALFRTCVSVKVSGGKAQAAHLATAIDAAILVHWPIRNTAGEGGGFFWTTSADIVNVKGCVDDDNVRGDQSSNNRADIAWN